MSAVTYTKDPNDVLPFGFDWSTWLAPGETVTGVTVNASAGITVNSSTTTSTTSSAILSGGVAKVPYTVQHVITTSFADTKALTMTIRVTNN